MLWLRIKQLFRLQNLTLILTVFTAGLAGYVGVDSGDTKFMFLTILAMLAAMVVGILLHNLDTQNFMNKITKDLSELESGNDGVILSMGRGNIPKLRDRIGEATEILLTGRTLSLVLRDRRFFRSLLERGVKVKLLFLNPENSELVEIVKPTLDLKNAIEPDLITTVSVLQQINEKLDLKKNLEVRVMDYPPTQNIAVITGPNQSSNVFAEVLSHDVQPDDRMGIIVYEKDSSQWFHYLKDQALKQWLDGKPFDLETNNSKRKKLR